MMLIKVSHSEDGLMVQYETSPTTVAEGQFHWCRLATVGVLE